MRRRRRVHRPNAVTGSGLGSAAAVCDSATPPRRAGCSPLAHDAVLTSSPWRHTVSAACVRARSQDTWRRARLLHRYIISAPAAPRGHWKLLSCSHKRPHRAEPLRDTEPSRLRRHSGTRSAECACILYPAWPSFESAHRPPVRFAGTPPPQGGWHGRLKSMRLARFHEFHYPQPCFPTQLF